MKPMTIPTQEPASPVLVAQGDGGGIDFDRPAEVRGSSAIEIVESIHGG